ncbi:MAG: nucleotidyltransferase family protein [Synergistaceae bacterium]|jgi:predicted nucleotidyltransferase|nr:nucleotidyltransferase family protein [Synergistaceae bacterium]
MNTNTDINAKKTSAPETGIGIIAEYNPFHNGHALHIERARRALGAVPVIVVLSSSFTQRGEAALVDKWTRASMALSNGVDLVLELPFASACNAASGFVRGAIDVLSATGLATHLSFGTEKVFVNVNVNDAGHTEPERLRVLETARGLKRVAPDIDMILNILMEEPPSFKVNLKKNLASGQAYPKAVAGALEREFPDAVPPAFAPNDTLALACLLHIRRKNLDLIPLPIQREGAGYHDLTPGRLASATAIRRAIAENESWPDSWPAGAMPAASLALLRRERERGRLCSGTETLWTLLRGILNRSSREELRRCAGMDEGLENLFLRHCARATSYEDFIGRCVCARYTRSRLQRQAIRLLVGLDRWTDAALSRCSPPYIRVLGYNQRGRALLRRCGKNASVPVITRLAAVSDPVARASADLEFRASRLRELLLPAPDLQYEERQRPVQDE